MAPVKQAPSLRDLAVKKSVEYIENICANISRRYKYRRLREERYDAAARLREYLVANFRPFMNEIYLQRLTRKKRCPYGDVWLSTFMHRNMRTLIVREDFTCEQFVDTFFWEKHLVNVPNLIEFEFIVFHFVVPVQIFQILSQNCYHLEVIKFEFSKTDRESFNYLMNIKTLRIIKDISPGAIQYGFGLEDPELICQILENLPKLEYISCGNIDGALMRLENDSTLALTDVSCFYPKTLPNTVHNIERFCPNLKSFSVHIYENVLDYHFYTIIFKTLTESILEVSTLQLNVSQCYDSADDFFYNKGKFLKSLEINLERGKLTYQDVIFVGKNCPHLEELTISYFFKYENTADALPRSHQVCDEPIFQKLINFKCTGPHNRIPIEMYLTHATNVQTISIHMRNGGMEPVPAYSKLIDMFIHNNPMTELQSLNIEFFCNKALAGLTQELIQLISYLSTFPKLVKLKLSNMPRCNRLNQYLDRLRDEIVLDNLDLTITCRPTFDPNIYDNEGFIIGHDSSDDYDIDDDDDDDDNDDVVIVDTQARKCQCLLF